MRRLELLISVSLISVSPAFGAPTDLEILKKIYAKIGEQFRLEENLPTSGKNFLVLMNPGFIVDPSFDPATATDEDKAVFYRLFDRVLEPTWLYSARPTMTTKIYENILTFHESPNFELSDDQKQKIEAAKKFLYEDVENQIESPTYLKFQELELLLADLDTQIADWRKNNPGMNPPPSLVIQQRRAVEKLETIGEAPEVLVHISNWRRYKKFDPEFAWAQAQRNFELNTRQTGGAGGQRFGIYGFYPFYKQWFNTDLSWHKITLNESDLERTIENRRTSISGGGGAGYGLFSVKANYNEGTEWKSDDQTVSGMTLSGEYLRVNLDPLYMDASIFGQDSWTFSTTAVGVNTGLISDGADANTGAKPNGQMPFLPVGLLLAKNVSLSGTWKHDLETYYKKVVDASAGLSYGPFSLSGKYHEDRDRKYTLGQVRGAGLEFASPQIIGVFVSLLPKSPSPSSEYDWPDSAKLEFDEGGEGVVMAVAGAEDKAPNIDQVRAILSEISPAYARAKVMQDDFEAEAPKPPVLE
jgi:hypothetical protein